MKFRLLITLIAVMIGFGSTSHADELFTEKSMGGKFSANAGFVSEYLWRGLSQSGNGSPAAQGGFDFTHDSGFSLGVWGSNINFAGNLEMDVYGGFSKDLGNKITMDVGAIYYHYPGQANAADLDFVEGSIGLGKDFGAFSGSAKISYSPDFTGSAGNATYLELGAGIPLGKIFTLNLHGGRQWMEENTTSGFDDYTDWSAGIGFAGAGFDFAVTYLGTDLPSGQCTNECSRLIASVGRSF